MIQCVKTGCSVYLEDYDEWAYGDAFEGDNFFIFRLCERGFQPINGPVKHFTVTKFEHWFDKNRTSQQVNSTLIAYARHVTNHGYYGIGV